MFYDGGLSIVEGNVSNSAEVKDVNKKFLIVQENVPDDESLYFVYQKKKGKPTKKVTAFALARDGHVTRLEYAILTSDVDFRELIRKIKG
jgi:hypothetical protein